MSDVDTLIVTFQTQLSDVMEAVVKTAMYEVTRLVEDGFLDELKRRDQVVESLQIQLQWAERKLSDQGGKDGRKTGKCVDCAEDDVELSCDTVDQSLQEQQDDIVRDHGVNGERNSVRWTRRRQDVVPETADSSTITHRSESQAIEEEEDVLTAADIQEEKVKKTSCSVHFGEWSGSPNSEGEPESHSTNEMNEEQQKHIQEDTEELRRNVVKQDPRLSHAYVFPKEREETHMATGLTVTTAGTPQNHRLAKEKVKTRSSQQKTQQELFSSVTADGNVLVTPSRDQISSSVYPKVRLRKSAVLGVSIKQEVIANPDVCVESDYNERLQESLLHLREGLNYVGDEEAAEEGEHQVYQAGDSQNRRDEEGSPSSSPSRTNINVSGEFSCLLIDEEGYLRDPSTMYPEQMSGGSNGRMSLQDQGIHIDPSLDSVEDMYGPLEACSDTLNVGESLPHQAGGRRRRKHCCNQCSMSFPDSASLKAHKQTHKSTGNVPPYSCTQCGKTFTKACNLKVHQRIHSWQGPPVCNHCGKGFPSFSDLKTHKCGQTDDKPYCCTVCGNKFSRLWNLKLHRRIHTQEKPHRCTICGKSFTRVDTLKVHQRTHTGERPYCCTVCGHSFKRLDYLKSHQRRHMANL